ncbi:hypothetical protein BsIDN1_54800 [Bacillus safensis]|uniref:Uncharacterized protein n=1 Tax=Bacillus safensis TaxID=561879 RepID=A0A5S9MGU5_BACIA|nr:hypothetical protein BsIDN1_54800 [Bacillus safensis]
MRNQELIRKAEMTLASLKTGGLMNATQSNTFIRMMQNTPTVLNDARIIPMESDSQKIEKNRLWPAYFAPSRRRQST